MGRYLISWDYGDGPDQKVIDADSEEKADIEAYALWKEGAESQADYGSVLFTELVAEENGFDFETGEEA